MREDDYGAHLLLRPLADEPLAPSKVSVSNAMRDGRRMRNRRWWAGGSAFVAALTAASVGGVLATQQTPRPTLPPDPPVPAACTVGHLPIGNHRSAEAPAADRSGTWLAAGSEPENWLNPRNFRNSLLIWRDGTLVTDVRAPGTQYSVTGVNASGAVTGNAQSGAYVFQEGRFHKLKGGEGMARGINDAGVVAGTIGRSGTDIRAARWASIDAEPELLPVPKGALPWLVTISDIAEDGTIIGTIAGDGYLWSPDGTGRYLAAPPQGDGVRSAAPRTDASAPPGSTFYPEVFRNGWIYGTRGALSPNVLRYHPPTGTWQRLNDEVKEPQRGELVRLAPRDARVYIGRAVLDLPLLLDGPSRRDSYLVTSVSDDVAVIAGWVMPPAEDTTTPRRPIIWRCR
ncbi:hypothetical protein ACQP2X_44445 [Actinoplanes sp. CA-131856]